jgi:hypothetical protein
MEQRPESGLWAEPERPHAVLAAEPARPDVDREQLDTAAREALLRRDAAQLAAQALRDVRRDLAVARVEFETAQAAADGRHVVELKTEARSAYQRALAAARNADDKQRAAATWMREIDRVNRASRAALASLVECQNRTIELHQKVEAMERTADVERIRAESAAAAHVDARDRLADGEEVALRRRLAGDGPASLPEAPQSTAAAPGAPAPTPTSGSASALATSGGMTDALLVPGTQRTLMAVPIEPDGSLDTLTYRPPTPTFGPAARAPEAGAPDSGRPRTPTVPLVIEGLLAGDRDALRRLAQEIAEITGAMPSRYLLLLQELVDGLTTAAVEAGRLAFDHRHPLWSQFNEEQCRTIARALRDLGFRFDPREGWYGGRSPSSPDLALALAYAGFDVRRMRRLPAGNELRELPSSVAVSTLEFVAAAAPDLSVGQVMRLLGHGAEALSDLWDDWGQLRALLLAEMTFVNA